MCNGKRWWFGSILFGAARFVTRASISAMLGAAAALATMNAGEVIGGGSTSGASFASALDLSLLDVAGVSHHLGVRPGRDALVIVFLSTDCPIANGYLPELNRVCGQFSSRVGRVDFFGVISDRETTLAAAIKHSADFKPEFPMLFDASGDLAAILRPTHVPEAFVFDRAGALVYRGRIDDSWVELGKRRSSATKHELREALEAAVAGKIVSVQSATPVGCLFEPKHGDARGKVTYTRDIAPILQANCVSCHRDGEVAPFALTAYRDAAKRADMLAQVVDSRLMPPWRPAPDFGHHLGVRRLTDSQIALFENWAEAGAPEGDQANLPQPPRFTDGWQLGEPDLVITAPEPFEVPAEGRDVFRCFVIPLPVDEDKLVAAVEFRPGNRRVVHHSLFFLDNRGEARKKDAADPGPGYSTFGGPGVLPSGSLGGWAPGQVPPVFQDGAGRMLRKGSDLILQMHYHPSGKAEIDQSTVGIHFVKQPSQKIIAPLMIIDRSLYIPAGACDHQMSGSYTLPADVTMIGVTPHMHLLGRQMKVAARLPDGTSEPLIWIKDWNFNWQDQYLLAQPIKLPKGTQLEVEAVYDNSAANPLNPNSPPKEVTWGEQTTDEMFICFFNVLVDDPDQLRTVITDNMRAAAMSRLKAGLPKLPALPKP
ncbi:MAG: redoxin domain-containing protein [Planctomycetaceae bacterium]